jgi:hypothetical protein
MLRDFQRVLGADIHRLIQSPHRQAPSMLAGIVRPSAFAVLGFMKSEKLVAQEQDILSAKPGVLEAAADVCFGVTRT